MLWGTVKKIVGIASAILVVLVMGVIVRHNLYRVRVWKFSAKPVYLWKVPFGPGANQLAVVKGIDGEIYGPLAFMAPRGQPVIADSYAHRIVLGIHPWHSLSTGELLPEDIVGTAHHVFFADNRTLGIYEISSGKPHKIVQLSPRPGYTEMIWHLAMDGNTLLVQGVKLGKGRYETWLRQYSTTGNLLSTLNRVESGYNLPLQTLSTLPIAVPIRSFAVAPNRDLVVETATSEKSQRTFQVFNQNNQMVWRGVLISPEPIWHCQLLGVNNMGWIYVGINLTEPRQALLGVLMRSGRTIFRRVHSVPVQSGVYGAVSSGGSLYLLQSSTKEYCIGKWTLKSKDVWSWNGRVL